ncbi:hypothetical protein FBU30_000987 [Linnemannia zychae]|nr:hypothetical protein FBU30_000987 [Linnemannia zychae]
MASALPVHNTPTKLSKINIPDRLPLHPDNGRITLPVEPPKYSKRDETYHHNKHLSKNDNGTPFYFVVGDDHILNDLLDGNGNNKAHVWGSDVMAPYEKRDDDMTQER